MEFVERFIDADGERLRILEAGTGAPLIVVADAMIGEPGSAETILAQTNRVIVVGAPGGAPQRASARLASVIGSLDAAPAAVLAASLAAPLALWLAIDWREQIRTIVLESPLAFSPHAATLAARSDGDWRRAFNAHPERKSAAAMLAVATLAALAQHRLASAQDEALRKGLAAFDSPVLALFGTRDPLAPVELGRFYKNLFRNAYFLMVYDAAHDIRGDRPEAFAEAVGDFLRRGAQFTVGERSARLHR